MTYRLFYAPATASMAVHWLLIELGVPFEAERVDFDAGDQRSPDYLRLNPAGRVPLLVVDGRPVAESVAIAMLLTERHPEAGFAPAPGDPARGAWLEIMVYIANVLQPALRDWFYAEKDGDPADAAAAKRLAQTRIQGCLDRFEAMLSDGRTYLNGERVTAADLLAVQHMRWTRNMERPATSRSRLMAYIQRMRARPAFIEVCRREGLTEWMNP